MTAPTSSESAPDLRSLLRGSATAVWLLLMVATCVSWWLGTDHSMFSNDHEVAGAVVLAIAFVKVFFIGRDFMHLSTAPRALSAVFNSWVVGVCAIIVAIYLLL